MIILTALFTGFISVFFFRSGLLGASGIVFMLILLASIVDVKAGSIPLTFVLVVMIFIGRELVQSFRADQIAQFGHIRGGGCGAFFGFILLRPFECPRPEVIAFILMVSEESGCFKVDIF